MIAVGIGAVAPWRVWVTESDLREARAAWLRARDADAPPDRVLDLLEELERMTRTATLQSRAGARGYGTAASTLRVPSPGDRRVGSSRFPATG